MPNFEIPNLDCTSKKISIQSTIVPVRKSLVQWLTESRFGISKFGIPVNKKTFKAEFWPPCFETFLEFREAHDDSNKNTKKSLPGFEVVP